MPKITLLQSDEDEDDADVAMGPGAALREATKRKDAGNSKFRDGDFAAACAQYTRGIQALDRGSAVLGKEPKETLVACLANRAAAFLKVDRFAEAIEDCSRTLELQPSHAKAVFRRAQAYEASANTPDIKEEAFREFVAKAADDMQRLTVLEPTNRDAKKAVTRLRGMLAPSSAPPDLAAASEKKEKAPLLPEVAPMISLEPPVVPPHVRMTSCELCRIAHHVLPADVLYEDELFIVMVEKVPASTHHFIVAPKAHLPTADKLITRHMPYLQHMQILAHRTLFRHGADLTDILLGFPLPPFASGHHLYLHAISPTRTISTFQWTTTYSRLAFLQLDTAVQRLQTDRQ